MGPPLEDRTQPVWPGANTDEPITAVHAGGDDDEIAMTYGEYPPAASDLAAHGRRADGVPFATSAVSTDNQACASCLAGLETADMAAVTDATSTRSRQRVPNDQPAQASPTGGPPASCADSLNWSRRQSSLGDHVEQRSVPPSPIPGIARQVVANASLLIACLVYMGWAYEDALYGYFHIAPLDLGVGIVEYMLRSLNLFSPALIIAAVPITVVAAARAWCSDGFADGKISTCLSAVPSALRLTSREATKQPTAGRVAVGGVGAAMTATALALAGSTSHIQISTYVVLALLAGGLLLLTLPTRADDHGRSPYALSLIVAVICAMWAASLYAHNLGIQAAKSFVRRLPAQTAVAIYSVHRLALSGPGMTVEHLPAGLGYHYRYQGLRLLIARSGTYYLLPVGWNPRQDLTYILNESDQIRIELLSGVQDAG